MRRFFVGVGIGLIIGWVTVPAVNAGRQFRTYMDAIERAVELLEQIEKNTRKG